jgi:hypothetical protein
MTNREAAEAARALKPVLKHLRSLSWDSSLCTKVQDVRDYLLTWDPPRGTKSELHSKSREGARRSKKS